MILRQVRWFFGGTLGGAGLGSTVAYLQHNKWDVTSSGLVRFGRAAYAVSFKFVFYQHHLSRVTDALLSVRNDSLDEIFVCDNFLFTLTDFQSCLHLGYVLIKGL